MAKRRQFFLKIFTIYSLLLLFFFIILSGIFFLRNKEILDSQARTQREIFIEQSRDKIDLGIKITDGIINQLRSYDNVKSYVRTSTDNYYDVIKIMEVLPSYLIAFPGNQCTIEIFKPGTQLVITPRNTLDMDSYLNKKSFSSGQINQIFEFVETSRLPYNYIVLASDNDQVIEPGGESFTVLRKLFFGGSYELVLFITFYERYFMPELNKYTGDTFIIARDEEIITYNTTLDVPDFQYLLEDFGSGFLQKSAQSQSDIIEEGYKEYFFTSLKSQLTDWHYVYVSSNEFVQGQVRTLVLTSIGIMFLLTAAGILIAYYTTKFVYKPVSSTIDSLRPYTKEDVDTDEFKYIVKTADSIYNDLQNTIKNSRISLKEKYIRELLYGSITSEPMTGPEPEAPPDGLCVALIEHINYPELVDNYSREALYSIRSKLLSILKNEIGSTYIWESAELDGRRYAMILHKSGNELIKRILNNAISRVQEEFEIELFVAIGKFVDAPHELSSSFHEALSILEYRHIMKKRAVIDMRDIENTRKEQFFYPMDFEANLISFTVNGKKPQALALLRRILDENLDRRQLGRDTIMQFIFAIVATIKRILQKVNKSESDFFENDSVLYLELRMYENNSQLAEKITGIFKSIIERILGDDEMLNTGIAEQMKEYIKSNYTKDISLDDIALHFNLSRGYICSLFKNELGRNFKEYLDMFRVEKAKELISKRSIKIRDLAGMIGYNDTGTFIRIFKKYVGISPGQYVENLRD